MRRILATHTVRSRAGNAFARLTVHALDDKGIWWKAYFQSPPEQQIPHRYIETLFNADRENKRKERKFKAVTHDQK